MNQFGGDYIGTFFSFSESFIFAVIVLILGFYLIKLLNRKLNESKLLDKVDPTIKRFALSGLQIGLFTVLTIVVISLLGVPMASVITVLASIGLAIGLALQGALSNLASGLMLLLYRPFNIGDSVIACNAEGKVKDISLFYTTLATNDNTVITVPNREIMNSTITNFSKETRRRVDVTFAVAKSEDQERVKHILTQGIQGNAKILPEPAPFVRLNKSTNEAMEFVVGVWVNTPDYWTVYYGLTDKLTADLKAGNIKGPALRIVQS